MPYYLLKIMNKYFIFLIVLVASLGFAGSVLAADSSSFGITLPNPLCFSSSNTPTSPQCAGNGWLDLNYTSEAECNAELGTPPPCINSFPGLVETVTTYITGLIASLAGLMFVISGILFVVSGGSPERIGQAKKTAIYAAIGVAIALAGSGLILVIKAVVGVP